MTATGLKVGAVSAALLVAASVNAGAQQADLPPAPALRLPADAAGGPVVAAGARSATSAVAAPRPAPRSRPLPLPALPAPAVPPGLPVVPGVTGGAAMSTSTADDADAASGGRSPDATGEGMRVGAFVLAGEVETGIVHVPRRGGDGAADSGLRSAPDLRLVSNWPRHQLRLSARGEFIAWKEGGGEAEGEVAAALRLDVRRGLRLRLRLADGMDKVGSSSGAISHDIDAGAALEYDRHRLSLTLAGGVLRHLQPGDSQDYTAPHAALRLRLRTSPALALYGEAGLDRRLFDVDCLPCGGERNSWGGYVEGGVELLRAPLWEGRLGVRVAARDYDDPAQGRFVGAGVVGNLDWRPTRATLLRLQSTFDLEDDAEGRTRRQTVALSWRQTLRRQLQGRARVEVENADVQSGADSRILRLGASLAWQVWRRLWITAGYDMERDITSGADTAAEHRFGLGLRQTF